MHILPRMNTMLDFILASPVELPEARNNLKLQNENFLSIVGFEPTPGPAAPGNESNVLST